jgi:hypothetical protein
MMSLDSNGNHLKRRTMSARKNFCPVGEELESRNMLNVGTPLLSAILQMESTHAAEQRSMVHQRVHARTIPKWSAHKPTGTSPDGTPTVTWQVPADLQNGFLVGAHSHSISGQTSTHGGRGAAGPVQELPGHAHQGPVV